MALETTQSMAGPLDAGIIRKLDEALLNAKVILSNAKKAKNVTLEDKKIVISGLTFAARATGLLADELELDLKNLKKKVETFRELQGNAKDLARDASSSRKGIDTLDVEVDVLYKKLSELLS